MYGISALLSSFSPILLFSSSIIFDKKSSCSTVSPLVPLPVLFTSSPFARISLVVSFPPTWFTSSITSISSAWLSLNSRSSAPITDLYAFRNTYLLCSSTSFISVFIETPTYIFKNFFILFLIMPALLPAASMRFVNPVNAAEIYTLSLDVFSFFKIILLALSTSSAISTPDAVSSLLIFNKSSRLAGSARVVVV